MLPACPRCGAPLEPTRDRCAYCGAPGTSPLLAGMAPTDWEETLSQGELRWGPPLTVEAPACDLELAFIRSRALLDDVDVDVVYRFDEGEGWAPGRTASAFGVAIRASASAGYDVSITLAGLVSVSRYEGGKLDAWLLEPMVSEGVAEGIGKENRLGIRMVKDRLTVRVNGLPIASLSDDARRAGAVELFVRPGASDASLVVSALSVRQPARD